MTKTQKADALLSMASRWQNGKPDLYYETAKRARIPEGEAIALQESIWAPYDWGGNGHGLYVLWASAALSEVAALGFDIETVEVR